MSGSESQFKPPLSRFLKMAIVAGVESAVRIHIDRGDNLNARDAGGQTPLMLAAARNKPHICKLLLEAGADPHLTDSDGKTALFIANANGARESASLFKPAFASELEAVYVNDAFPLPADEAPANDDLISIAEFDSVETPSQPGLPEADRAALQLPEIVESDAELDPTAPEHDEGGAWPTVPMPATAELIDFDKDGVTLDLSGWEAEADLATPDGDPTVLATASKVQKAISGHAPIDISADWDDFEAFLPERASPLPKADDTEARERLRSLLLRATREGSVPNEAIEDLTLNDDQTPNTDAAALLRMVVNDLGAEADERHEYSTHHENFVVHVEPRESPDEEQTIDDALAFIDELESRRNEPLRIYQRDFQSVTLLTADEEITLGKAMEQSVEAALDALAGSITAIAAVVESSHLVKSKTKPLRWMSVGTREDVPVMADNHGESPPPKTDGADDDLESDKGSQDDLDEGSPEDELSEFIANAERLLATVGSLKATPAATKTRREALGSMGLSGSFLLGFSESGHIAERESAGALRLAMQSYRAARDRMTVANLKLVQSIAKKYLYSGMPLDDLLQEGNIGLLKSVERFDWRRGFRFSTYATWWIRQQVSRFVAEKSKTIRVPVHIYEKVQRIGHIARGFEMDHGRAATAAEISELADLPLRKVKTYMQIADEPLPIHELDIDSMIASDARDEYVLRDPMDIVSDRDSATVIDKLFGTFKRKEEHILRMRFGIGITDAMTLDEIGIRLGVTRERIRQIESKAMRRLIQRGRHDALLTALNGPNLPKRPNHDEDDDDTKPSDSADEAQVKELLNTVSTKPPRKNARKLPPVPVEIPNHNAYPIETATRPHSVPGSVQKLIDAATVLGASVELDKKGEGNSIWIDFGKAPTALERSLIRKMISLGFKPWHEKWYWR